LTQRKVYLVCGPPGSGKTTWVRERALPGDLVWDQDDFLRYLFHFGPDARPDLPHGIGVAREAREAILRALVSFPVGRAFLIMGGADRQEREAIASSVGAELVMLATPEAECLQRIADDPTRGSVRWEEWEAAVKRWWTTYRTGRS
jgi:hypothetical protein